jgi:K+ transporter
MIALVALIVWRFHWLLVLAVWIPFIALDGLYLSAALTKIPNGAWFTLLLALILSSIFVLWRYGKEKQWSAEGRGRTNLSKLIIKNEHGGWSLPTSMGGRNLNPIKGELTYHISNPSQLTNAIRHRHFLRQNRRRRPPRLRKLHPQIRSHPRNPNPAASARPIASLR